MLPVFEKSVAKFGNMVERSERRVCDQMRLLDAELNPKVELLKTVLMYKRRKQSNELICYLLANVP